MRVSGGRSHAVSAPRSIVIAVATLLVAQALAGQVSAEIPHENFDLVGSDLDMLVQLLRTSVDYTEMSLVALIGERVDFAYENLTVVVGLLGPAELLADEIEDIASSYYSLSLLVPPFVTLAEGVDSFAGLEAELIEDRGILRTLFSQDTLTSEETSLAVATINEATSLIAVMTSMIDEMLVTAEEIASLVVGGDAPFADNDLEELLERLRGLLYLIEEEMIDFMNGGSSGTDPWMDVEPFLTLWLSDNEVYIGERLSGGGYLFFDGAFKAGQEVSVVIDGTEMTTVETGEYGRFDFSIQIPVEAAWLGPHQVYCSALLYFGRLDSSPSNFLVTTIPTRLVVEVDDAEVSPGDTLFTKLALTDARGLPVSGALCAVWLDGDVAEVRTDPGGSASWSVPADALGYGDHILRAEYDGVLPYASSSSETTVVVVNVPTTIELELFSSRLQIGYYLVGEGRLLANASTPLEGMTVTMSVDRAQVANVTTKADGQFSFTIETDNLSLGSHMVKAEFLQRAELWRYSVNETSFTIVVIKPVLEYPFWPFVPGWSEGPPEATYNIFFGNYAYLTWLAIVIVGASIVKALQLRHALADRRAEAARRSKSSAPSTPMPFPRPEDVMIAGLVGRGGPPRDPNGRVIWEYNRLIRFITDRRMVSLRGSMTHWEIAKVLGAVGYPRDTVEDATRLFEAAIYSGRRLQVADMESMVAYTSALLRGGEGRGGGRAA